METLSLKLCEMGSTEGTPTPGDVYLSWGVVLVPKGAQLC